jgi:hypothetical protein
VPLESIQPAGVLALVSLVVPWWSQGKETPLPWGCVRQRQPIRMAGMSTADKHDSNVGYGGTSGSCKVALMPWVSPQLTELVLAELLM